MKKTDPKNHIFRFFLISVLEFFVLILIAIILIAKLTSDNLNLVDKSQYELFYYSFSLFTIITFKALIFIDNNESIVYFRMKLILFYVFEVILIIAWLSGADLRTVSFSDIINGDLFSSFIFIILFLFFQFLSFIFMRSVHAHEHNPNFDVDRVTNELLNPKFDKNYREEE